MPQLPRPAALHVRMVCEGRRAEGSVTADALVQPAGLLVPGSTPGRPLNFRWGFLTLRYRFLSHSHASRTCGIWSVWPSLKVLPLPCLETGREIQAGQGARRAQGRRGAAEARVHSVAYSTGALQFPQTVLRLALVSNEKKKSVSLGQWRSRGERGGRE